MTLINDITEFLEANRGKKNVPCIPPPKMLKVESSNVDSMGWDKESEQLWVKFKGGKKVVYVYYGVPEKVAVSVIQSDSIGRAVHDQLRDKYESDVIPTSKKK